MVNHLHVNLHSNRLENDYFFFSTHKEAAYEGTLSEQSHSDDVLLLHLEDRKQFFEQLLNIQTITENFVDIKNMLLRQTSQVRTVPNQYQTIILSISFVLSPTDLSLLKRFILHPTHCQKNIAIYLKKPALVQQEDQFFDSIIKQNYPVAKSYLYNLYAASKTKQSSDTKLKNAALANLLFFLLLSKKDKDREKDLIAYYSFFGRNVLFKKLEIATRLELWFELAQMLTKKDKSYSLAQDCYQKARRELEHDPHLDQEAKVLRQCAIDNGAALIYLQEKKLQQALDLELQARQRLLGIQTSRDRNVLLFQILINASRIYGILEDAQKQKKLLDEAYHLNQAQQLHFDSFIQLNVVKYHLSRQQIQEACQLFNALLEANTHHGQEVELIKIGLDLVQQVSDVEKIKLLHMLCLALNGRYSYQIQSMHQYIKQLSPEPSHVLTSIDEYLQTISIREELIHKIESIE